MLEGWSSGRRRRRMIDMVLSDQAERGLGKDASKLAKELSKGV